MLPSLKCKNPYLCVQTRLCIWISNTTCSLPASLDSPSSPFFIPLNPLSPPLFPPHLASSPPPIPLLRSSQPPGYSIFLCYHLERSLFHACSNFFHRFIFLFVSIFPSCFAVVSFSLSLCFFLLPHFLSSWVCFLILCLSSSLSPSCFIFNPHDVKSSHPHLLTIPGFFLLWQLKGNGVISPRWIKRNQKVPESASLALGEVIPWER